MTSSGIYQIRNLVDSFIYIGGTTNFKKRKYKHFHYLRGNKHCNVRLQNAYDKYGEENFVFEILITCDPTMLIWYEQQFIDQWNPEYNIYRFAGSSLGACRSDEFKKRVSEAQRKPKTEETKRRMSIAQKGHKTSDGTKEKISASKLGKKYTEDQKRRKAESIILNRKNRQGLKDSG